MRAALLVAMLVLPSLAHAQAVEEPSAVERALAWLAAQGPDGWTYATTAAEAAAQAGHDPKTWPSPEENVFAHLRPYGGADGIYYSHLRIAHAAGTSGYDPRDVNGDDYVQRIRANFTAGQFGDPTFVNDDVWAILALRAAGVPADDEEIQSAVAAIRSRELPDGGWGYSILSTKGSTDVTGAALAALAAAGQDMRGFASARAFLDGTYDAASHGHREGGGIGVNCQSTVWALHGYHALGVRERADSLSYLALLQNDDGGVRRSDGASDAFCTEEWIVAMSGARYPLPGYEGVTVRAPECHAREPCVLVATGARLDVAWDDGATGATRTFDGAGEHGYRYHAVRSDGHARGAGSLAVLSARPVLGAFRENVSLARHAALTLDLSNATDPDGRIVALEVDWGDGNVTATPTHAYDLPGTYDITVRARDDAGVWSAPARLVALVENRAPVLTALPARVVADRVAGVALDVVASDPDGDAVTLTWRAGALHGEGAPRFVPATLGETTVEVVATDAFGANATGSFLVEVVNTPPRLSLRAHAGEVLADASDPDGPAPTVAWSIDGVEARPPIRPGAGTHLVRAVATDADGATTNATLTVSADAPREPVAPRIATFEASLEAGMLQIRFETTPSDATALVHWRSDAGEGDLAAPGNVELPGATWASATLEVEHDGLRIARHSGLLVPPPAPARAPAPEPAGAAVVVAPVAPSLPSSQAPTTEPIEPASLKAQPAAQRQTPGPSLALALALAIMLARRRH